MPQKFLGFTFQNHHSQEELIDIKSPAMPMIMSFKTKGDKGLPKKF